MSHPEQRNFCRWVKRKHPKFFNGTLVIDVGSLDLNGNNRYLFSDFFNPCRYLGIDIVKGKNVDIVGKAHEVLPDMYRRAITSKYRWHIEPEEIVPDVVISTEMLEHDYYWRQSFSAMYDSLKRGGLLLITAAGEGRKEHGTTEHHAWCSPGTNDYYKNISNEMLGSILKPCMFSEYYVAQDKKNCDIFFYGIKN